MSITLIQGGSFVSGGVSKIIPLQGGANYMTVTNLTQAATQQATGRGVKFEWWQDRTPQDGALEWKKTNSTDAINLVAVTSGGFTYVPTTPPPTAPLTGTTITNANPAVASVTNTYSNGDRVRIYGVVGMRQISTMPFTISSVSGSAFTLLGLDASGFAAAATAFQVRKIAAFENVLPEYLFITGITQATNAVVTVSTLTTGVYAVGMNIRLDIPADYGMQEMNGLEATIVAVGAYTLTLNINSSGFAAFAFPASAISVVQPRFATLAPSGQRAYYDLDTNIQYGYNVNEAPFRSVYQFPYMLLASGAQSPAGSTSDVIEWQAFRYE